VSFALFGFLSIMWVLILIGGGILISILGPITVTGYGDFNWILSSGIKAIIAFILVIAWIFILIKLKNWIFRKEIKY